MKNNLLYIAVVFASVMSYAQQGNVGVNTVDPKATLDVAKKTANNTSDVEGILIPRVSKNKAFLMGGNTSIEVSTLIYVDNVSDYTTTPVDAKVVDITENGYYSWNGTKWVQVSSQNGQEWKDGTNTSGTNLVYANQAKVAGNDVVVTDDGKVGIGSTIPKAFLDVQGNIRLAKNRSSFTDVNSYPTQNSDNTLIFGNPGSHDNFEIFRTTYPQNTLGDANGTLFFNGIDRGNSPSNVSFVFGSTLPSKEFTPILYMNGQNHRVGIGTTSPSTKLHVNGIGRFDATRFQLVGEDHNYIEFYPQGISSGRKAYIGYPSVNSTDLNIHNETSGAKINLITRSGSNITLLDTNGNVGIGITSPGYKLDVNGNMKILTNGSSYLSGKTGTQGINGSGQTTASYHPFLRQRTSSGHYVNIGGLRDWFGFVGYNKDRTSNGFDYSMVMNLANGNVGIGTTGPSAKLHVNGNTRIGSLPTGTTTDQLVTADASGNLRKVSRSSIENLEKITEGGNTGYRIAGRNPANYGNIGVNAIDLSYSDSASATKGATGNKAVAMGDKTTASGSISIAMGWLTTASGMSSTAMGLGTTASGFSSTATGNDTKALSHYSTAMGSQTTASGWSSTAMGSVTIASGIVSTAMGRETTASSSHSTAMGVLNTNETSPEATTYSQNNKRLLVVGNGFNNLKSDAFTILRNGKVGIDIDHFEDTTNSAKLQVNGTIASTSTSISSYPDYVFQEYYTGESALKPSYTFKSLNEVERFVKEKGHLPGYKSEKEIRAEGFVDITKTQMTNMEKIEELYLHTIEQEKKIESQQKEIEALKAQNKKIIELEALVKKILNK